MNELKESTVMFTGRRPKDLVGYVTDLYRQFVDDLSAYICRLYDRGFRCFISGGAQGFDQLVFWAVNKAKRKHPDIRNICYIPFPEYGIRWPKASLFGQNDFALMLRLADEVRYTADTSSILAILRRNSDMCDDASLCVALFPDDSWRDISRGSGTASCMKYAFSHGMHIEQIQYAIADNHLHFGNVVSVQ